MYLKYVEMLAIGFHENMKLGDQTPERGHFIAKATYSVVFVTLIITNFHLHLIKLW